MTQPHRHLNRHPHHHPNRHIFVDISSHGFGHLGQTAPVLNRLGATVAGLHLTIRSGLPEWKLRQRIAVPFTHIAAASDIGYLMVDALRIDLAATELAYRAAASELPERIERDLQLFATLRPDAVLANVSYVPLAAAARAGIPAIALCSLNWAELFAHYFAARIEHEPWATGFHADMLAAYRGARFLRATPGMPMTDLADVVSIGTLAELGRERREELRSSLGIAPTARVVLVTFGGIPTRLPVEGWPQMENTHWLVPQNWRVTSADFHAIESLGWKFTDLLRSADAIVAKPGYGTFAEAACNGTAVLYQRTESWAEQDGLIEWLRANARCAEISADDLHKGNLATPLDAVLRLTAPPVPIPDGIEQAATHIARLIT